MPDFWREAGTRYLGERLGYEPILLELKASLYLGLRRFPEAFSLLTAAVDLFLSLAAGGLPHRPRARTPPPALHSPQLGGQPLQSRTPPGGGGSPAGPEESGGGSRECAGPPPLGLGRGRIAAKLSAWHLLGDQTLSGRDLCTSSRLEECHSKIHDSGHAYAENSDALLRRKITISPLCARIKELIVSG
jgi:hypothetical protein